MTEKLRQIYAELASGKLSQSDALEMIKSLKAPEQAAEAGSLLFSPVWIRADIDSSDASSGESTDRHIILCELPSIDVDKLRAEVSSAVCEQLPVAAENDVAQRSNVDLFDGWIEVSQREPAGRSRRGLLRPGEDRAQRSVPRPRVHAGGRGR